MPGVGKYQDLQVVIEVRNLVGCDKVEHLCKMFEFLRYWWNRLKNWYTDVTEPWYPGTTELQECVTATVRGYVPLTDQEILARKQLYASLHRPVTGYTYLIERPLCSKTS